MPQLQNLVLTDRQSTPATHTYVPRDIVNNVGTVVETTGVPVGEPRFSISSRFVNNERYKITLKLTVPVVQTQTVNGVSSIVVVRSAYVDTTFTFDKSSTAEERNNIVGLFQSAFAPSNKLTNDTLVKLEGVY